MFAETQQLEEKRTLNLKVKLEDGSYGYVFSTSEGDTGTRWHCHMCDIFVTGFGNLKMHMAGKKHKLKLAMRSHPKALFPRIEREEFEEDFPQLAPGQPVPPGFEDKVRRVTQIQPELDKVITKPLIGLEYLLELTDEIGNTEPKYVCLLCEKKGERHVVLGHLTSFEHYNKYIGMYFPTASKAIVSDFPKTKDGKKAMLIILMNICRAIEKKHGRLQPTAVDKHTFEAKKNKYLAQIIEDHHFREKPGETFVELVDKNILNSVHTFPTDLHMPWDDKSKDDGLSTINKGKIAAGQDRLRTLDTESSYEKKEASVPVANRSLKGLPKERHTSPRRSDRSPVEKCKSSDVAGDDVNAENMGKSPLSSISSTSISRSRSRSKSRSRKKARARSRSYSPSVSRPAYSSSYRESRLESSRSLHRRPSRASPVGHAPYSRYRYRKSRSHSRSRSRSRPGVRSRSKSPIRSHHHKKETSRSSPTRKRSPKDEKEIKIDEKSKWDTFRHEIDKIEREAAKLLKSHEQNPEKHPLYPDEWKKFWSIRYKELQAEGKDPNKHNFKPEWIEFWNKRMLFLHKEEVKNKKEQLKKKLGLPKEEPETIPILKKKPPLHVNKDVPAVSLETPKNIVITTNDKTQTKPSSKHMGSVMKNNKSSTPPVKEKPYEKELDVKPKISEKKLKEKPKLKKEVIEEIKVLKRQENKKPDVIEILEEAEIVPILRLLTAMESQLGSLGPKVNTLMGEALSLEKIKLHSADSLLMVPENIVLFETVKEKLKGQLMAGIVEKNMLSATQSCLELLVKILKKVDENNIKPIIVSKPPDNLKKSVVENVSLVEETKPVVVPEVNPVDKVAIAQQIAAALVAQGKTDVTQEELEQLINIFTGMAHASKGSGSVISTAQFVAMQQQQQQQQQRVVGVNLIHTQKPVVMMPDVSPASKEPVTPLQQLLSVVTSKPSSYTVSASGSSKDTVSGLQLLQTAYDEPRISPVTNSIVRGDKQRNISPQGAPMSVHQKKQHSSGNENRTGKEISYLSEVELRTLLQNFKDLSAHEQQCLITYLRKLEESDPVRVEQLRKYVVIEPPVKKSPLFVTYKPTPSPDRLKIAAGKRGRVSPFSQRHFSSNPLIEEEQTKKATHEKEAESKNSPDDSDEEYTYEEIYAAASRKVRESEEAKAKELEKERASAKQSESSGTASNKSEDPAVLLRETKAMIANLMGQLPSKYATKHSVVSSPRKDSHITNSAVKQDISLSTNASASSMYPANTQSYSGAYDSGQSAQHIPVAAPTSNRAPAQQHYTRYQQSNYSTPYAGSQGTDFSNTTQYENNYANNYSDSYYHSQPSEPPNQEYSSNIQNSGAPPQNTYQGDDYYQYGQNSYQEQRADYYPYQGQSRSYY